MTVVGLNAFIYGGVELPEPGLDDKGSASVYILRMAVSAITWERLSPGYEAPLGRWRHSATLVRNAEIVVFGGHYSLDERLADTWILDCISRRWRRVVDCGNPPSARAAHSSVLHADQIYVFGGYGGVGKSRRHFNDVYALNSSTWAWRPVHTSGTPPPIRYLHYYRLRSFSVLTAYKCSPSRSSHAAHVINGKMFIFGGSNSSESLKDVWCLDLGGRPCPSWTEVLAPLASPAWSMSSAFVDSIPSAKIFMFGGMKGPLLDSGVGVMDGTLRIFDSDQHHWVLPPLSSSEIRPCPRSDSAIVMVQRTLLSRYRSVCMLIISAGCEELSHYFIWGLGG
jgi:hypothetical protein